MRHSRSEELRDKARQMIRKPVPPPTPQTAHAAVRAVASMSRDTADCALLLDMLGLDAASGAIPLRRSA